MCHDLDHRGTTNSFQIISVSQVYMGAAGSGSMSTQLIIAAKIVRSHAKVRLLSPSPEISVGSPLQF